MLCWLHLVSFTALKKLGQFLGRGCVNRMMYVNDISFILLPIFFIVARYTCFIKSTIQRRGVLWRVNCCVALFSAVTAVIFYLNNFGLAWVFLWLLAFNGDIVGTLLLYRKDRYSGRRKLNKMEILFWCISIAAGCLLVVLPWLFMTLDLVYVNVGTSIPDRLLSAKLTISGVLYTVLGIELILLNPYTLSSLRKLKEDLNRDQ